MFAWKVDKDKKFEPSFAQLAVIMLLLIIGRTNFVSEKYMTPIFFKLKGNFI